jgi:hypothetical protein
MKKILFFNKFHIGDHLFCKSFIKQFCELNKTFDISLLINYNSFLFSDIPNLNIIISSIDNNYNNNLINNFIDPLNITNNYNNNLIINFIDPLNITNINNNIFIYYLNIINKFHKTIHYFIYNDIIFINLWIGTAQNLSCNDIEANVSKCNKYYNNIIKYINNTHNLNINLINNIHEFPIIPYVNIDNFLKYKSNNKKIIFYYNYYPKSQQSFDNINHEKNIKYLSNKYKDYIIFCAIKPNYSNSNIISIDNFNYKIDITCKNVAQSYYCALNSDIIFIFDVGANWYYLNDEFQEKFNGTCFHMTTYNTFYNKLNNNFINKKNKVILLNPCDLYSIII